MTNFLFVVCLCTHVCVANCTSRVSWGATPCLVFFSLLSTGFSTLAARTGKNFFEKKVSRDTDLNLSAQVCVLVRCIVCERLRWSLYQRYEGRDNIVIGHVVTRPD